MKDEPPSKRILIALAIFLAVCLLIGLRTEDKAFGVWFMTGVAPAKTPIIQENTFLTTAPHSSPKILASYSGDIFQDLTYKTLIKCLAFYESGYNPNAIGDHSTSFGLLQYQQSTWDMYCSGDIWNPQAQAQCADKMLEEDFRNIWHWSTAKLCL